MFDRFTASAREVIVGAQDESRKLNHDYIGTEHLLLALTADHIQPAREVFESLGLDRQRLRSEVREIIGTGVKSPEGHIPFTPRTKKVLEYSMREALQMNHPYISAEHLLLGLLREGGGIAAQVLLANGLELDGARERVMELTEIGRLPTSELLDPPLPTTSHPLPLRRDELALVDDEDSCDTLGREILAGHVAGLLGRFTAPGRRDGRGGTAVISIDGRWGAGKTLLANLIAKRLGEDGSRSSTGAGPHQLVDPIVIRFDCWRESAVGPRWWSLAAAMKAQVEASRSLLARLILLALSVGARLARSRALIFAGLTLVVVAAGATALIQRGTAGNGDPAAEWASLASTLDGFMRAIGGIAAVGALLLTAGRVLFWASPAIGRLYLQADSDPLSEVSSIVARLRRWCPRTGDPRHARETALTAWIITVAGCTALQLTSRPEAGLKVPTAMPGGPWGLDATIVSATSILVLVVVAVGWSIPYSNSWTPQKVIPASTRSQSSTRPGTPRRYRRMAWVVAVPLMAAAASCAATWLARGGGLDPRWLPLLATAALMLGVALFIWALSRHLDKPKRPILLILDELDRCSPEHTVEYLETIHTLMRLGNPPRYLRRWRNEAPLVVLVPADSRWVRTAFEKHYDTFSDLGEPTRKLGADFLFKLFDHTVLVPELTADQLGRYAAELTEGLSNEPSSTRSLAVETQRDLVELSASEAEASAADEATSSKRARHLMSTYPTILPANPRLVKRTVNCFGMLQAIAQYRNEEVSPDTLARAAIFLVRFPTLVDELLTTQAPPNEKTLRKPEQAGSWGRPDVLDVLRLGDGSFLPPRTLGQCFGRVYPSEVRTT